MNTLHNIERARLSLQKESLINALNFYKRSRSLSMRVMAQSNPQETLSRIVALMTEFSHSLSIALKCGASISSINNHDINNYLSIDLSNGANNLFTEQKSFLLEQAFSKDKFSSFADEVMSILKDVDSLSVEENCETGDLLCEYYELSVQSSKPRLWSVAMRHSSFDYLKSHAREIIFSRTSSTEPQFAIYQLRIEHSSTGEISLSRERIYTSFDE